MEREHMEETPDYDRPIAPGSEMGLSRPGMPSVESAVNIEKLGRPPSEFEKVFAWYDHYKKTVDVGAIPESELNTNLDLIALRNTKAEIERLMGEADQEGILEEVRQQLEDDYKELRGYSPAERLDHIRSGRVLAPLEDIRIGNLDWERDLWVLPRFKNLQTRFKGLPNFLYLEIRESIIKYERRNSLTPERRKALELTRDPRILMDSSVYVGDSEFNRVRRQRMKESKFRQMRGGYSGMLEFHWAENVEELIPSVAEYLASVEKGMPDERVQDVYEYLITERKDGLRMLEAARLRLGIPDDDSVIKRLRSVIEARIDVFGGDRTVNRGGWGHFIDFWDHFGNNFISHQDAVYLEDAMVPMALHRLSMEDGIYWRGTRYEKDIQGRIERERPSDGEIELFQKEKQREIIEFLTTHELVLNERDFKNRFEGGEPSFDDRVEQILLHHPNLEKSRVFHKIKERLDHKDGLSVLTEDQRRQEIRQRILLRIKAIEPEVESNLPAGGRERDIALWKWVEVQNDKNPIAWFPSGWDQVRLSIDRPELLLARALTKDEFEKMYQPVDINSYIVGAEDEDELNNPAYLTREEYDNPIKQEEWWQRRRIQAEQKFQEARSWQIFSGAASRYGGTRLRFYEPDGKTVIENKPFFVELRDRIAALPLGTFPIRDKLKEFGVANIFPIWSHYLVNDDPTMAWFAPLMGKTPDDKVAMIQMVEQERRAYRKVIDGIVQEFMVLKDGNGYRKRVNHKGGNIDIRKNLNSRFIISTSGGVGATDLVPAMDLGIDDLFMEFGQEDAREFMGYVRRRDEVEFQDQPIWNILDPIDYWKRLNGAETLRKIISGGDLGEGKRAPGFLNGPLSSAFKMRDFFSHGDYYRDKRAHPDGKLSDYGELTKIGKDTLVNTAKEVIQPLIEVMEGRKYVENRMPQFGSGGWKYDNTLLWYAFRDWVKTSSEFKEGFNYADEARSNLAVIFYENILDANYLILPSQERKRLFPDEEHKTNSTR